MVSRVPTWSGKKVGTRVPRDYVLALFVLVVMFAALLLSYPWELLTVGSLLYLAAIPVAAAHYKRLERAHMPAGGTVEMQPPAQEEARPDRLN
jgi:CDP-diacylglycerol--serine O-phosphatidyltransferase